MISFGTKLDNPSSKLAGPRKFEHRYGILAILAILIAMTRHALEILLDRVAGWPEAAQEELMRSVAEIENKHSGVYRLNDEERTAIRRGLREMREGKIASDEEVAALFARYRA